MLPMLPVSGAPYNKQVSWQAAKSLITKAKKKIQRCDTVSQGAVQPVSPNVLSTSLHTQQLPNQHVR